MVLKVKLSCVGKISEIIILLLLAIIILKHVVEISALLNPNKTKKFFKSIENEFHFFQFVS